MQTVCVSVRISIGDTLLLNDRVRQIHKMVNQSSFARMQGMFPEGPSRTTHVIMPSIIPPEIDQNYYLARAFQIPGTASTNSKLTPWYKNWKVWYKRVGLIITGTPVLVLIVLFSNPRNQTLQLKLELILIFHIWGDNCIIIFCLFDNWRSKFGYFQTEEVMIFCLFILLE